MIKKILFWCIREENLVVYNLDSGASIGRDVKKAKAIDFSIRKVDPTNGKKVVFNGGSTDRGGRSTSTGLAKDFLKSRIENIDIYGLSLMFNSPVKKYFLLGGIGKHTVLQLLYTVYAMQEEFS